MTGRRQETHCSKETEISRILECMQNIERSINKIDHVLNGNGRPGLVQDVVKIKAQIEFGKWLLPVLITILSIIVTLSIDIILK